MELNMATQTLSALVDAANDALFYAAPLSSDERARLARGIARHGGGEGAYAGSFALSREERATGVRLFTGERLTSASARHVMGEESARALLLLRVTEKSVAAALAQATRGLSGVVLSAADADHPRGAGGVFCCANCSVALWRHLAAGGLDRDERRLVHGLRHLRQRRDGKGEWRSHAFYYTLLTLSEIDLPEAKRELEYAAPLCERKVRRKPSADRYARRRHDVLERALGRI
jgi:hypothetical protein